MGSVNEGVCMLEDADDDGVEEVDDDGMVTPQPQGPVGIDDEDDVLGVLAGVLGAGDEIVEVMTEVVHSLWHEGLDVGGGGGGATLEGVVGAGGLYGVGVDAGEDGAGGDIGLVEVCIGGVVLHSGGMVVTVTVTGIEGAHCTARGTIMGMSLAGNVTVS